MIHQLKCFKSASHQGSTNCSILPSRMGENGEQGEHEKGGKYQPDDLKHSACFEMLRDLGGNNTSVL